MNSSIIEEKYVSLFNANSDIKVIAPGRINLLGEHTDYNGGFVLPAAIDKAIYFSIGKREDHEVNLYAFDLAEKVNFGLNDLRKVKEEWANFLIGVIYILKEQGAIIENGFNVCFGGDVPLGAGLSSSAAVECGVATGLNLLFDLKKTKKELVLVAQQAEHEFAGVKCGIMDMYASVFGKEDSLIKLDCKEIAHEYLPFVLEGYDVILLNTGVKHNLGDSAYNKRRADCESAVALFQRYDSNLEVLRDVSNSMFEKHSKELSEEVSKRAKYVIQETERMDLAVKALAQNNIPAFGKLMFQTHRGLQHLYEVSCPELDFLVDEAEQHEAVVGSRMMGGGFGGCTINIVKKSYVEEFVRIIREKYTKKFDLSLEFYPVKITDGCRNPEEVKKAL